MFLAWFVLLDHYIIKKGRTVVREIISETSFLKNTCLFSDAKLLFVHETDIVNYI